jgi:hypothetical protein
LTTGWYESDGPFDPNLQACLAMCQSWIILCKEVLDELGEYFGLTGLREEVGEDALKRIPRR